MGSPSKPAPGRHPWAGGLLSSHARYEHQAPSSLPQATKRYKLISAAGLPLPQA